MRNWITILTMLITIIPMANGQSIEDMRADLRWINESIRGLWQENESNPEAYEKCMETLERLEQQADRMSPEFLENILILKANTYQRTGRPGEAIRDYQRMVDEFPNSRYTDQRKQKILNISKQMNREAIPAAPPSAPQETQPGNPYVVDPFGEIERIMSTASSLYKIGNRDPQTYEQLIEQLQDLYGRTDPTMLEARGDILLCEHRLLQVASKDTDREAVILNRILSECPGTRAADQVTAMLETIETRKALEGNGVFPNFEFTGLNGEKISLEDYRGKVVLVDFWATWCPPCIYELPNVKSVYKKYHEEGFEIIGISLDNDRSRLETFLQKEKMDWPQYFDGLGWKNKISTRYGIKSIPATFLIGPDGQIIDKDLRGNSLKSAVRKALKDL